MVSKSLHNFAYIYIYIGFGGLACWPLVPKFAGSNPAEAVGFLGRKILSTPSFGGEVKPSVPCRRIAACKRSLNLPQFHLSLLGSLASLRKQRHVVAKVGTSKGGEKQWQIIPKNLLRMQCAKSHNRALVPAGLASRAEY